MLNYSVDHFLLRDGMIFCCGWGFHQTNNITNIILKIHYIDNTYDEINAKYGQQRSDVKIHYPNILDITNSGFIVFTKIQYKKILNIALFWELDNNEFIESKLDFNNSNREKEYLYYLKRTIKILKKSKDICHYSGFMFLIKLSYNFLLNINILSLINKSSCRTYNIKNKELFIIVDHDMGGGANIFRNLYINELLSSGKTIIFLGFHPYNLSFFLDIIDSNNITRHYIKSPLELFAFIIECNIQEIFYNCAVSFPHPFVIIDMMFLLKRIYKCKLIVAVHDYYLICPSHLLLNNTGIYCNIPELTNCSYCLPNHRNQFVQISGIQSIILWRERWHTLLLAADEVRMFSDSSKALLRKAYPLLPLNKLSTIPHKMPTNIKEAKISAGLFLHIGIIGTIEYHKGSNVVKDLMLLIEKNSLNIKITIIGTIDIKVLNNIITVTGEYIPEHLVNIVEKTGVNIILFPSIWPETFSYVSHEIISMNVPMACFNIGAQADLIKSYSKGLILNSMNADDILKKLEYLWRKTYYLGDQQNL